MILWLLISRDDEATSCRLGSRIEAIARVLQGGKIASQRKSWCFDRAVAPPDQAKRGARRRRPRRAAGGRKEPLCFDFSAHMGR